MGAVGKAIGNVFSGVSTLLFGKQKTPSLTASVGAVPAPSRKQDTGAVVVTGSDTAEERRTSKSSSKRLSSSLGGGGGSGIQI